MVCATISARCRVRLAITTGRGAIYNGVSAGRSCAVGRSPWCRALISGSLRRRGPVVSSGPVPAIICQVDSRPYSCGRAIWYRYSREHVGVWCKGVDGGSFSGHSCICTALI